MGGFTKTKPPLRAAHLNFFRLCEHVRNASTQRFENKKALSGFVYGGEDGISHFNSLENYYSQNVHNLTGLGLINRSVVTLKLIPTVR
jgi:hypothetical protein